MRKIFSLILALTVCLSAFLNPVHAEEELPLNGQDTLADELGLEESEITSDPDAETAALLTELVFALSDAEASANGRLVLDQVCDTFRNNIDPSSMDAAASEKLDGWLDSMEPLRLTDSERARQHSLFQYNQAVLLKAVVDEPLALLSHAHSYDLKDVAQAVITPVFESPETYMAFQYPADTYFLQLNQTFREEEMQVLDGIKAEALSCLNDFVKKKDLSEEYLFTEDAVQKYTEWKHSGDLSGKIHFLEENQETYSGYAGLWLLAAQSYFENGDYSKCLSAVQTYEEAQKPACKTDRNYARLLPAAVISLLETVRLVDTRVERIAACVENLIKNTDGNDWALRYFASMAYMEISRSGDNSYMKDRWRKNACTVSGSVVKHLTAFQQDLNHSYMAELIQEKAPQGASSEEKKKIRELNTLLKEDRKTSLPPVSLPLLLSADLLKAFLEREASDEEGRTEAEAALYPDNDPVFLNRVIEQQYRNEPAEEISGNEIILDKKKLSIPADLLSYDCTISVIADNGTDHWTFSDWTVENIKRKDPDDIHSFTSELTSAKYSSFKLTENMEISVEVIPTGLVSCEPLSAKYRTVPAKFLFFFNTIKLERAD
ncbi:MAG: hypothetical protein IJM63_09575 [Solobacterium sp.]|nr:hypothetical protein [Solobacterium sp.]